MSPFEEERGINLVLMKRRRKGVAVTAVISVEVKLFFSLHPSRNA